MRMRVWKDSEEPENVRAVLRASSAAELWREEEVVVLGRPKCILETKRVERRPEKSEESDLGVWRGGNLGRWVEGATETEAEEEVGAEVVTARGWEGTRCGSHGRWVGLGCWRIWGWVLVVVMDRCGGVDAIVKGEEGMIWDWEREIR